MEPPKLINNFNSRNLNKCAFLLAGTAEFKDVVFIDGSKIATIYLDNVDREVVKSFWIPGVQVDLMAFLRARAFLRTKIDEKRH